MAEHMSTNVKTGFFFEGLHQWVFRSNVTTDFGRT